MKKLFVAFLLAFAPSIAMASVDSDYFNATDTAATSTFSGSIDVSGSAKLGSGSGLMEMVNGVLKAIPNSIHIDSTDFWGFGTTTQYSPLIQWEFVNQSTGGNGGGVVTTNYDSSSPFASFTARGSRGTTASPSAIQSGNVLGQFGFSGFDGVNFPNSPANIRGIASGNWTSTSHGVDMVFMTTANGTTTRTEKMRLTGDGNLTVQGRGTFKQGASVGTTTSLATNGLTVDGPVVVKNHDIVVDGNVQTGTGIYSSGPSTFLSDVTIGTSTSAAMNGLTVDGPVAVKNHDIVVDGNVQTGTGIYSSGPSTFLSDVTIGTSTSYASNGLTVAGDVFLKRAGTAKITLDSDTAGSCIIMKDSDGSGYTYITANDGVLSATTSPC